MSRLTRDARLETRQARSRLKARHEPYWKQIHPGLSIGYRKGARGGVWMARRLLDGKYAKKTLGTADDTADADGMEVLDYKQAHLQALEFNPTPEQRARGPYTVRDAMDDYLSWYKVHRKDHQRAKYTVEAHILPKLGDVTVADLTAPKLNKWLQGLVEAPIRRRGAKNVVEVDPNDPAAMRRRKASANRILTVLKAALNRAWEQGLAPSTDAWRRVKPFRAVDVPKERYLSEQECTRLLNACASEFRPLVRAALLTGCRYGELCRLRVQDFNPDAGVIVIQESKPGKRRHVPLTAEGVEFFKQTTAGKLRGALVFTRPDGEAWGKSHQARRMRDASAAAKIEPPVSFHDLRNTYGSLLAMKGVPLNVISEVLGHADTRMTQLHYAHLQPSYIADTVRANLPSFGSEDTNVVPLEKKAGRRG
jgi:integrase